MSNVAGLSSSHTVTDAVAYLDELTVFEDGRAVKRHKSPATVTFWDGGSKIEVKRERYKIPRRGGGMRSAVKEFTFNSRRRLMRKIAELKRDTLPLFITLTYPSVYPDDSKVYKEHLRRFGIAIRRKYHGSAFIWRLEFQERGAPHYHLLGYNLPRSGKELKSFKQWLSLTWYRIVDSGDEKHLRAGTQAKRLQSYRKVIGYVSKRVGKVSPVQVVSGELGKDTQATAAYVGRWWGVIGSESLPWATKLMVTILEARAVQLIRYMRRYARLRVTRAYKSLSIFCDVSGWTKHLPMLLYPDEEPPLKSGVSRLPVFGRVVDERQA